MDSTRYYQWEAYATTDNTLDIAEWTKIGEKTDTAVSTAEGTTVAFDATAMRYIRVYGTYHSANVGYHFAEIFAYADVTFNGDSGAVSDTINWAIDSGYNLTITGTGAMPDYAAETDRPWNAYKALAKTISIGEGITAVGKQSFSHFTSLESISLSDTVTTLGYDCFAYDGTVPYLRMSKNVTVMKQGTAWATTFTTISCYYDWKLFQMNLTELGDYNSAYGNATWVDVVESLEGKEVMPCTKYNGIVFENWGGETQVLLCPKINGIFELNKFKAAVWTLTFEGDDGSSKTVNLKVSSFFGADGTTDSGILRFQPCVEPEPENRFVPVKGVTYTVTFDVTIDGTAYTNRLADCSMDVEPVTHTFYKITWMVDGVVAAVNHCMEGKIPTVPEGLFEEYDEDGYHVMGAAEDPVPATADATYNVVSQRVGLTVKPWNAGYENWAGGTGGTQFQLLLCPDDYTGADLGLISNDAWKNYTFVLTINGTDYAINPSSAYSPGLLRFETMLAEDKFTPVAGTIYTIYMTIYNLDGTVAYRTTTPANVAIPDGFVPAYTCVGEHTYGEWVVVTYPTTTKEGERKHTCTVCGHEEPEAIAVIQVGDANGDGTISIADITAILDYLSVTEEEQAQMIADRTVVEDALDADGSGSISIADVTAVLEIIAGSAAEG